MRLTYVLHVLWIVEYANVVLNIISITVVLCVPCTAPMCNNFIIFYSINAIINGLIVEILGCWTRPEWWLA